MPRGSEWEEVIQQTNDDQLTKELLKKEEKLKHLKKEKKAYLREINDIQRSKTWSYAHKAKQLSGKLNDLFGKKEILDHTEYRQRLEQELEDTKEELYQLKKQYQKKFLKDQSLNTYQIEEFVRSVRDKGKIVDFLEQLIEEKNKLSNNYNHALRYIARLFMTENVEYRHFIYSQILSALTIDEVPEFMLREGLIEPKEQRLSLKKIPSFRACLNMRVRQKQLVEQLPEYILEDKIDAYYFVDQLHVRRPEVYAQKFSLNDIPKQNYSVIKPIDGAGARGVYLIYSEHEIIDLYRSRKLTNWEELTFSMKQDLETNLVEEDSWFMEEFILDHYETRKQANDLKFYCFYGKVGVILEINRYPERKHCWWTRTGERIRTGKYDEDLFLGEGVSEKELVMVEMISSKIPAPFIRIDFLRSGNELVFGEFTAKPGNYDEFNDEIDRLLGDYYLAAEARLTNDLLTGKQFPEFTEFCKTLGYGLGMIQR